MHFATPKMWNWGQISCSWIEQFGKPWCWKNKRKTNENACVPVVQKPWTQQDTCPFRKHWHNDVTGVVKKRMYGTSMSILISVTLWNTEAHTSSFYETGSPHSLYPLCTLQYCHLTTLSLTTYTPTQLILGLDSRSSWITRGVRCNTPNPQLFLVIIFVWLSMRKTWMGLKKYPWPNLWMTLQSCILCAKFTNFWNSHSKHTETPLVASHVVAWGMT